MAEFKISQANWAAKSKSEKEVWFRKFLKGLPKEDKTTRSTEGRMTIPNAQKTATDLLRP